MYKIQTLVTISFLIEKIYFYQLFMVNAASNNCISNNTINKTI
ncbi:hypothetical protein A1OE_153 [Candidatus Endolissoclinum faulkneri L2]|uniref:Uncharacterized protein n=1 Tax=Candidatus Endolissoclinum faulkneri L2 TaxID=1193729 RepID=K7YLJ3_9PROT|nr:hypothetical protein A1OE_153 [Candidatus Endolissoclinum faulkneri L2]